MRAPLKYTDPFGLRPEQPGQAESITAGFARAFGSLFPSHTGYGMRPPPSGGFGLIRGEAVQTMQGGIGRGGMMLAAGAGAVYGTAVTGAMAAPVLAEVPAAVSAAGTAARDTFRIYGPRIGNAFGNFVTEAASGVPTLTPAAAGVGAVGGFGSRLFMSTLDDAGGAAARLFPNQLPGRLAAELAEAASVGARPLQATLSAIEQAAAQGTGTLKFVVTEAGELLISPKFVNGVEISHAVLSGGRAVLTAGEAEIAVTGGRAVGLFIEPHSGHFRPSAASLGHAIDAFGALDIFFP